MNRPQLVPKQKAFHRNAQPLENSNVPGDWGSAPTSKTARIGIHRSVLFWQSAAALALLAKVFTLYFLLARSNINIVLYKYGLYRIVINTVNKVKTLYN